MSHTFARLAIVGLLFSLSSPLTHAADLPDAATTRALELRGTIGKSLTVRMHLEIRDVVRDGSIVVGEQYTGYYIYAGRREQLQLKGYFNAQGPGGAADHPLVILAEYVNGKKTAEFVGTFSDRAFTGHWDAMESERSLPFSLRVTSRSGPLR